MSIVNDIFAAGMLQAIHEAGLRVPEDISIVSFDNTYISRIVSPPASSISCDYRELAQKLVGTAVDAAEGREVPMSQLIRTTLHERSSCRRIE